MFAASAQQLGFRNPAKAVQQCDYKRHNQDAAALTRTRNSVTGCLRG